MDPLIKSKCIARQLQRPIGRLEAMIVPLAAGGRDSHGHPIERDDVMMERLVEAIGEARVALQEAQNTVAQWHAGA